MKVLTLIITLLLSLQITSAQLTERDREWNQPVEPFRIVGNVYYVGAAEVTSFLITSPKGHILIDSGFAETVPQIRKNIEKLGFKLADVKYLLNTQAHNDHAGGLAELKRLTDAKMIASIEDAKALEVGDKDNFSWGGKYAFEPVKVDRRIKDGHVVSLGGSKLKAVITPGHTQGATMWTMTVRDKDRDVLIAFVSSASIPGYTLLNNTKYPNIISDYELTFEKMKRLRPDVFLGSHGSFFDLLEKAEKIRKNPTINPFIDPQGYQDYVSESEKSFREQLERERKANKP